MIGSTVKCYRKNIIWFYHHYIFHTYNDHREAFEYRIIKWTVLKTFIIPINVTEIPSLHIPLTATSYYCTESDLTLSRLYVM